MSITNAISGLTAAGGLLCLGGGYLPDSIPTALAASAVFASSINIFGGFLITKRMLDMFKRKGDAPEYNQLYNLSGVAALGMLGAGHASGMAGVYHMGYLASSLLCIGSICGLSS